MKKEMVFMAATAILFIVAAAVALSIWHSWYLYCGAVLTGFVALMLLTVILKRQINIKLRQNRTIKDGWQYKSRFYSIVLGFYEMNLLTNLFLVACTKDLLNIRVLIIFADFAMAIITLILAMYWCERKDWRIWLIKALFD